MYQAKAVAREPGMIPAAVAIALREGEDGPEALFIHRAERADDTWSGQIAFPGGRREPSDPHLRATAIRETREEVGVELTDAERLGVLDDMYPRTPVLPPVVVRPFVFGLVDRPPLTLSNEVQDAFWLSFAALNASGVQREVTIRHRELERVFPAYVLENRTIWGMTERILTNLLSLAKSTSSLDNIK
ncbi:MAG TPA: CoA pyrophosphatase [Gemmatimonadales bacterium]|nr:CoA pyrophosphatase [Gemmatimonadales bacterium]